MVGPRATFRSSDLLTPHLHLIAAINCPRDRIARLVAIQFGTLSQFGKHEKMEAANRPQVVRQPQTLDTRYGRSKSDVSIPHPLDPTSPFNRGDKLPKRPNCTISSHSIWHFVTIWQYLKNGGRKSTPSCETTPDSRHTVW